MGLSRFIISLMPYLVGAFFIYMFVFSPGSPLGKSTDPAKEFCISKGYTQATDEKYEAYNNPNLVGIECDNRTIFVKNCILKNVTDKFGEVTTNKNCTWVKKK